MPKNILSRQSSLFTLLAIIIPFALTGLIIFSRDARVSAAQQGTIVTLIPPDQAYTGEVIIVKLVVNNAQNLAGYQSTVRYGVGDLRATGATPEKGLSLSGRDIKHLASVWGEGTVVLGAATCPVADCNDSQYDSAPRYLQGVDGYVELASLEFYTQIPGRYDLILENTHLVDPQGNQLGAALANAVLEVNTK